MTAWMFISPCPSTVKDLENDTEYEFRVRAKNSAGLGNPSDSTGPVHVKPKFSKLSITQVQFTIKKDFKITIAQGPGQIFRSQVDWES